MKSVRVFSQTAADVYTLQGLGLEITQSDELPSAIKISQFELATDFGSIIKYLRDYSGPVVLDNPSRAQEGLFPYIDILIFELYEAETFLNHSLKTPEIIQGAAFDLLNLGAKSVLIKGVATQETSWIHDYWSNGSRSFWLTQRSCSQHQYPESGTVFSTAMTAALALGYSSEDAVIIATMYIHQAIRQAQSTLYYGGFPESQVDIPYVASQPIYADPIPFKPSHYLGLYPVVDSVQWVEFLLKQGVKTIQLRIKKRAPTLEDEMRRSIALAKEYQATLFINDYWDLALKLDAEAVHLGQSDLDNADLDSIRRKGLLLGVSTYCYYEVARAHAICPSYIAIGPIYTTTSKDLEFAAQGIEKLQRWTRTLSYPLVAIGGINLERASDVAATGMSGVALISAITAADDPAKATQDLITILKTKPRP